MKKSRTQQDVGYDFMLSMLRGEFSLTLAISLVSHFFHLFTPCLFPLNKLIVFIGGAVHRVDEILSHFVHLCSITAQECAVHPWHNVPDCVRCLLPFARMPEADSVHQEQAYYPIASSPGCAWLQLRLKIQFPYPSSVSEFPISWHNPSAN